MIKKHALVVHSGGMDSSLCLAHAIKEHGRENILSMSFTYSQRHSLELKRAEEICQKWKVDHLEIDIHCLSEITENALINSQMEINHQEGSVPNTLVVGRNGLMGRVAAIHANHLGASKIYMGVIGVEAANSGYRDCSREYMDKLESILKIDLDDPKFEILTPIVHMTKKETMNFAQKLGVLKYLLENTVTCYEGIEKLGCAKCPACKLRNEGIRQFLSENPSFNFSYRHEFISHNS